MNREVVLHLLRFGGALAVLFALSRWEWVVERVREPYCEALGGSLAWAFRLVGLQVTRHGASVLGPRGGGITVVPECDGIVLLCLFLAGVVAFPKPRAWLPYGWALAAVAVLVAVNWLRLAVMALVGFYQPELFDTMHHYVMQAVLLVVTLLLYTSWLRAVEPRLASEGAS